jgi:hypothetical protein
MAVGVEKYSASADLARLLPGETLHRLQSAAPRLPDSDVKVDAATKRVVRTPCGPGGASFKKNACPAGLSCFGVPAEVGSSHGVLATFADTAGCEMLSSLPPGVAFVYTSDIKLRLRDGSGKVVVRHFQLFPTMDAPSDMDKDALESLIYSAGSWLVCRFSGGVGGGPFPSPPLFEWGAAGAVQSEMLLRLEDDDEASAVVSALCACYPSLRGPDRFWAAAALTLFAEEGGEEDSPSFGFEGFCGWGGGVMASRVYDALERARLLDADEEGCGEELCAALAYLKMCQWGVPSGEDEVGGGGTRAKSSVEEVAEGTNKRRKKADERQHRCLHQEETGCSQ